MQVPFPVEAPHRVRPDLRRLSGPCCVRDDQAAPYLSAKRALIERARPAPLCYQRTDLPGLAAALQAAAPLLGLPEAPVADAAVEPADPAAALEARAHAMALAMQEDFVVLRSGPGGVVAELLHVCFPSGWAPEQKLGLSFAEVHAPVADGQALRRAAPALASAMLARGPFERYVWTVADSPALSRHPARTAATPVRELRDLHFRCERQVVLPLPAHGRALFLIRVFVAPLERVLDTGKRRARLLAALRSMSPETIRYKNLQRQIDVIERVLGPQLQDDFQTESTA